MTAQCVYSGRTDARYSMLRNDDIVATVLDNHPQKTEFIQSESCDVNILRQRGRFGLFVSLGSNKTTTMLGHLSKVVESSVLFKPVLDTRGEQTVITDHTGKISANAVMISRAEQMLSNIPFGARNIFVDEFYAGRWFDWSIAVASCKGLSSDFIWIEY